MIQSVNGIGIIQIGSVNNPIEFAFPAGGLFSMSEDAPNIIAAIGLDH
jgi:hypothetical protein